MTAPKPFSIAIADDVLADLRERLERTRLPTASIDDGWNRGMSPAYLRELIDYWRDGFDWRAQERALNDVNHQRVELGGLGIHYIHEKGRGKRVVPLLLTHGWPDSFIRFMKIIPLLTDPAAHGLSDEIAFDVVVPSMPGHGFSDIPTDAGINCTRIADTWRRLMVDVLGYDFFYAHGGDMGSVVTMMLAVRHDDVVPAIHLTNVPYTVNGPAIASGTAATDREREFIARRRAWSKEQGAYASVQETTPQSLGPAVTDSPAGLAAWILPHWRAWSDCGGDIESVFTRNELLTNLTIYWATATAESSFNLYFEEAHDTAAIEVDLPVRVPTGFAIFPQDLVPPPREWAERFFAVSRWSEMPAGGHFAALEQPELLAEELRAFFREVHDGISSS